MNFEDNIFILNVRIRMMQDLLILNADPSLFLSKTMDDIAFVDTILVNLLSGLKNNEKLIERDEQFFNLAESERVFADLLLDLTGGGSAFSRALSPEMKEKARHIMTNSVERRKLIRGEITELKNSPAEPVVSYDEMQELLSR